MSEYSNSSNSIQIYVSPSKEFIFKKNDLTVKFNLLNEEIKKEDNFIFNSEMQKYDAEIVVGKIDTPSSNYLIISNKVKFIGEFLSSKIFQIMKFEYIPINLGISVNDDDSRYLRMCDDFLARNTLYFSDTLDLTISIKNYNTQNISPNHLGGFIFPYTISDFCWNYNLAKFFDAKYMNEFIYPIINGFIGIKTITEYPLPTVYKTDYLIIARKERNRNGMRFFYRGADEKGNCANFVEIEEILSLSEKDIQKVFSFAQIRGSIPLIWTQYPNFGLNPPILIKENYQKNYDAFKKHIEKVFENYGDCVIVNLIDKKKYQQIIGEHYQQIVGDYKKENPTVKNNVDIAWFDFHSECKKMKYHNLSKLLKYASINKAVNSFDYTEMNVSNLREIKQNEHRNILLHDSEKTKFNKIQKGVFRTNCVDSLDRTNVVQTVFGRYFLHKIFKDIQFINNFNGEPFEEFKPSFEKDFKNMWADNGDAISKAYSGTRAMKADFVRTGKRKPQGYLDDGMLSLMRLYLNNFCDGYNQDCSDYFLDEINPKKDSFKQHNNVNTFIMIPTAIIFALFMYYFLSGIALPKDYHLNFKIFLFKMILFFGNLYLTVRVVFMNFKKSLIDTPTKLE
ncbi:MAG: hypothetical protein MJ252_19000 [archaeon]|nr:hypothetical protein [archaeon]